MASIITLLLQKRELRQREWSRHGKIKPQVTDRSSGWTRFLLSLFPFAVGIFICFPKRKGKKENARKKSSLAGYMTGGKGQRCGSVLAMTSQASSWLTLLLSLYINDSFWRLVLQHSLSLAGCTCYPGMGTASGLLAGPNSGQAQPRGGLPRQRAAGELEGTWPSWRLGSSTAPLQL